MISKKTFIYYSVLFSITCLVVYSYYFNLKGSFIWESDGFTQHFQLFNEYVEVLHKLFRGDGFSQWNWSIGAGADTITSYGYYVIGDPFVYLGALFPESLREFSFHFLVFLRMWCVGLSYLVFAKKFKVSHRAGLLGTFMYTFSFFVIYNVKRHPFFILPVIWYPLLCLGVEKIIRKESGLLFSLMVGISAIANFYFFYKLTILTFLYAMVRYVSLYDFKDWRQLIKTVGRGILHYIVGVLISAVVFLPMIDGFLNSSRNMEALGINLLFYHISYYVVLIHNLFVPYSYFWSVGGLSIFSLFTVVFLFRTKKSKSFSGVMLLILGIFLLIPFFGSFMNGMSGPYNRFSFAIPLFVAFASGQFLEERSKLQKQDLHLLKHLLVGFSIIYTVAAIARSMFLFYLSPIIFGWLIWWVLNYELKRSLSKQRTSQFSLLLGVIVLVNMATSAMNLYYPYGDNAIDDTVKLNTSLDQYEELFGGIQNQLPNDKQYRVGVTSQDSHVRNQFIYHDLMGLSTYLSVTNGYLSQFAQEMEVASFQLIQPLRNGMDDRRILNHLLNVQYILTEEINEHYLPQGYEVIHRSNGNPRFIIAKTEAQFPFAYAENTIISREDFSTFNPLEKELILTQAVVVEATENIELKKIDEKFQLKEAVKEVDYTFNYDDPKLQPLEDGGLLVEKSGTSFKIVLEKETELRDHDLFVYLQGLEYQWINKPFHMPDDTSYNITFFYGEREKTFRQSDRYSFSTYFPREKLFVNLGQADQETDTLSIQLEDTGEYNIDELSIYALPVNQISDQAISDKKSKAALDITVFEDEKIEGIIEREEEGILVTSIPYEKGWTVTVNGERVDAVKANIGFIGVPLEQGTSKVVFSYQNPYLKIGIILSLLGILLLGCIQKFYLSNR